MKPKCFEMAVLLAVNDVMLKETGELQNEGAARRVVTEVLDVFAHGNPGFDATLDLGIDANAENFVADAAEEAQI